MKYSVIYVEDEVETAKIVELYLQQAGFNVACYHDGHSAKRALENLKFDLAILDIMLPGITGNQLLKQTVALSLPTIMVTAKSTETDKILSLDGGADDYVCKPFSPKELVSRVKALIRRSYQEAEQSRYYFGDFILDVENRRLSENNLSLDITMIEFELLSILVKYPLKSFSRLELLDSISKNNLEASERTIDTHILNLRKKIEKNRRNPQWIRTIFGVGYTFSDKVKAC